MGAYAGTDAIEWFGRTEPAVNLNAGLMRNFFTVRIMDGHQITSALASPAGTPHWIPNLTAELERATRNIRQRLGNVNDFAQQIFFLGDGIQRTATDRFFDLLQPGTWSPTGLTQMASDTVSESLQFARFFIPGQTSYLSWLELP